MNESPPVQSLVDAVEMIALNPPLPGNRRAISRCMQCLDDLYYASRISVDQWERLRTILLDAYA